MSESKHVNSPTTDSPGPRSISRRIFLGNISVFSLMAIVGSTLLEACTPLPPTIPPAVPVIPPSTKPESAPSPASPFTLLEALKNRKSASAFQSQPLPREKLLELLWAAWGINRPDSGKRTAPTAVNAQEIDVYVLLPEGAYLYDAKGNQITSVLAQDLRSKATPGFMREAPVHLLFVADYAKFRTMPQAQKELYSAAHTGFIGQNVYLYCAANGMGARFYAGVDRATLKDILKLREDQSIVFAQAVGYPKV
jgi:nitroreductase